MTRMIERWFPCAEVSAQSASGWGNGRNEKSLFTWFASRPVAQAKAAVLTSLLPWPDGPEEQRRLQDLVRRAMGARDGAWEEAVAEIRKAHPEGASLLDPFSGRAIIPNEAARLCVEAHGIDYSPVATLAGLLLADYPMRDWSGEPRFRFSDRGPERLMPNDAARLCDDVEQVLGEIGRRFAGRMAPYYPTHEGRLPWAYLWAVTLPCVECGRRFPLVGSLTLRHPIPTVDEPGQSFRIEATTETGEFSAVPHPGPPTGLPTLRSLTRGGARVSGKVAVCPFCGHVHVKDVYKRLAASGQGRDALLLVADDDENFGKVFRPPTAPEEAALVVAEAVLAGEQPFSPTLPAVPDERIPEGNGDTVRASLYGARTYGDLLPTRQKLGFVHLARIIGDLHQELQSVHGISESYAQALASYGSAAMVKRLRRSTRGAFLETLKSVRANRLKVASVYSNESSVAFNFDFVEVGIGVGAGTWESITADTIRMLRSVCDRRGGVPATITRGTALSLPFPNRALSAVVTDPPYDDMIDYSDASDFFYVWLKRALVEAHPWLGFTSHPLGVQEKDHEIIVKRGGGQVGDHRDRAFYDRMLGEALAEARRVVRPDGVVTIVFGHGDPDVWHRLLQAISTAGLALTGSWPAKTETSGGANAANIVTTLTMSCRPVAANRPTGRGNLVEAEVRREVRARVPDWDRSGLAPTDQLMASAGPAMEVVGRYAEVLNALGEPVDAMRYLYVARRAVEDAVAIPIDDVPLAAFDPKTRFALFWVRLYGRTIAPKSEARWQALASDLTLAALRCVLTEADRGVRFTRAAEARGEVDETSSVIEVALAMAKAWPDGLDAVGEVLGASLRDEDDAQLWATMSYLASRLPEADPDRHAWTSLVRHRRGITAKVQGTVAGRRSQEDPARPRQTGLFDVAGAER